VARPRVHRPSPAAIEGTAIALILLVGLVRRISQLTTVVSEPLRGDAINYRLVAIRVPLTEPYSTWVREPGWPWLARIWFDVFGDSPVELRILSMLFGMATIAASWWFARRFFESRVVGVVTAFLLATNTELILQSTSGLRLEALSFFLVVFVYFTFVDGLATRRRVAGLAASGTAAILVALVAFTAVVPLVVYAAWRHRLGLRQALLVFGVILALLTPHLIHEQRAYGDPFWASNIAAVFYRNYEYLVVTHTGCEGCPTLAQFHANGVSGSHETWTDYIFGRHDLRTVIDRFATGYRKTFFQRSYISRRLLGPRSSNAGSNALFLAAVVGAVGIALSRRRMFLAVPPLLLAGTAFVIPLHIDPRLVEHLAPFMTMIAASSWLVVVAIAGFARPYVIGDTRASGHEHRHAPPEPEPAPEASERAPLR
jgi:hypothetical protein